MSVTATTNRLHQAVRRLMPESTTGPSDAGLAFAEEAAWLLLFDQLLCSAVFEITGQETPSKATSISWLLRELSSETLKLMSVKELSRMLNEPGERLYEFKVARHQLLLAQKPVQPHSENRIVSAAAEDSPTQAMQQWLTDFETWLVSAREYNQEY